MSNPTVAELDRFEELVLIQGMKTAQAMKAMKADGYPDRAPAFWQAERNRHMAELRQFQWELAECIGPGDEIHGHQG
jgi:hypothetical protein